MLCISFMIQLLRNVEGKQARCRNGGMKDGLVANLLCRKTMGIVGAGAIGRRVAALWKAFGCRVLAFGRSTVSDPAIDEQVSLEELLERTDVVSLHCPLTEQTKGMIGREELARMRRHAILINTARGGVLNSAALAGALERGESQVRPATSSRWSRLCPKIIHYCTVQTQSSRRTSPSPLRSPWSSARRSCSTTSMPGWTGIRSTQSETCTGRHA